MKYEYTEIENELLYSEYHDRHYREPVSIELINEMAKEGWRFVCFRENEMKALLERPVENTTC